MLTRQELKEELDWDGKWFWWRRAKQGRTQARPAGSYTSDGYRAIWVNGKRYQEHRLVWLWHYGKFPKEQLDHINGNREDNRIENLREGNSINAHNRSNNAGWQNIEKRGQRYRVVVHRYGKRYSGGSYATLKEAQEAREELSARVYKL